jgi:hypothetical protein
VPIDVTINSIKDASILNMHLPVIRSKFPLGDRFALAICGCGKDINPV